MLGAAGPALARAGEGAERPSAERFAAVVRLGDVSLELGNARAALEHYQQALEIARGLVQKAPDSAPAQRRVYLCHNRLGEASLELGDARGAVLHYQRGLDVALRLAQKEPDSSLARRDVSVSYTRLGDVLVRLGRTDDARASYQKDLEIALRLAEKYPDSLQAQIDLVGSYFKLGRCDERAAEPARAAEWYDRGLTILRRLDKEGKLKGSPVYGQQMHILEESVAFCRDAARAIDSLDFALKQPPDRAARLLFVRARAQIRAGEHAGAAGTAERLAELAPKDPNKLYLAACLQSLCCAGVAPGKKDGELRAAERRLRDGYAGRAIALLRQAVRAGFKDAAALKTSSDLDPLRERAEFRRLLAEMEPKRPPGR
jgi:tetratricopeptide (TPR) repeat protein